MTRSYATRYKTTSRLFVGKLITALDQPSDRTLLALFFATVFYLAYGLPLFIGRDGSEAPPLRAAEVIGFVAVAVTIARIGSDRILRKADLIAIAIATIALTHPWHSMAVVMLTVIGIFFLSREDRRLASLGQLCIGLAWISLWGKVVLSFIEPWLLPIEAALGFAPLSLFGSFSLVGNAILGNGHGVIVFTGCSAFANTITAVFIWLALVKIQGTEFQGWHFRGLAFSLAAIVLLNTVRLTLMAYSYDGYVFWHNGYGATIMSLAMLLVVLGFFYWGASHRESVA
jgi:hypothetical protein